jgi:hypothetical protein
LIPTISLTAGQLPKNQKSTTQSEIGGILSYPFDLERTEKRFSQPDGRKGSSDKAISNQLRLSYNRIGKE